jgi:FkbM family methyltransferase
MPIWSAIDRLILKNPGLRQRLTLWLEGNHDRDVTICGFKLRINTLREHGYLLASRLQHYNSLLRDEMPVLLSLSHLLARVDTFVDVGANVGVFSSALAKFRSVHTFRHYAFEANPDTFIRLHETVRGLNVDARQLAISDNDGELEFVAGAVSHVFTTVQNRSEYSLQTPTVKVAARRLDSLNLDGRQMLLKIDVEGHELAVLRGAEGLFQADRIFGVYLDGYGDPAIPEFLSARGFAFYDGRTLQPSPVPGYSLLALKLKT